jgi:multidrug efflux pump subunit AcrB
VNDAAVQQLVSLAYGGVTATTIRESDRQTPVIVRLPQSLRQTTDDLDSLEVRNAAGSNVPLGEVVSIAPSTETSISILRDGRPTVTILAEVQGRLPSAVLADFTRQVGTRTISPGVTVSYAGENEELEKSFRNLGIALAIGLLINQTILLWEFRAPAVPCRAVGCAAGRGWGDLRPCRYR